MNMPHSVAVVLNAAIALLASMAVWTLWKLAQQQLPLSSVWLAIVLVAACVGLWRRLVWGRLMFSCISVWAAAVVVAHLIPTLDERSGETVLEAVFGALPPVWLAWLIIVACATTMLAPALIIGWRKAWFRSSLW